MINKEQALEIASQQLISAGLGAKYEFDSCSFFKERKGKYPRPEIWVVRFMKLPSTDGSVTDDGDELYVVSIETENGAIHSFCGM